MQKVQDPLTPFTEEDREILQNICSQSHDKFVNFVKKFRGSKIISPQVFNGELFSGEKALEKGLIDGLGTATSVLGSLHPGVEINFV